MLHKVRIYLRNEAAVQACKKYREIWTIFQVKILSSVDIYKTPDMNISSAIRRQARSCLPNSVRWFAQFRQALIAA
jgi:hypothetical protein